MKLEVSKTKANESLLVLQEESGTFENINSTIKCEEGGSWSLGKRSVVENTTIKIASGAKLIIAEGAILKNVEIAVRNPGAILKIGKMFGMYHSRIVCDEKILIGSNVLIGHYCLVTDSQIHSIDKIKRREEALAIRQKRKIKLSNVKTLPLEIGDDCQICDGAKILFPSDGELLEKMIISAGSIIGANAVVKHPIFEPDSIAVKVPAKVVGSAIKIS